ncbi:DUF4064 domain-containing protein [Lapidilactobacillus bayanensis]|uniref:DUF4064 domain-containing protein n=1 Tax=Lapidilactobacillus bayanensis TaxID=2485998 RepID=UPI000F7A4F6F|nr:DUF4064 domain-containing protein [Lapidilactobacillus bayanensis]
MSRRLELIIGYIGAGIVVIFMGGFTVVMNILTKHEYQTVIYPVFEKYLTEVPTQKGLTLFKTLGAWFGFTVIAVLILVAIASMLLRAHKRINLAGILYLAAGLATLFGSQMIAYPIAFIFFVVATLCFLRKDTSKDDASTD